MVRPVLEDDTGLRVMYEPPKHDSIGPPIATIDIVAVHGIGAHPDDTWSKNVGSSDAPLYVNWLQQPEMLPAVVPSARIMRYGYESRWFGDDTEDTVRLKASTIAKQLLLQLNIERERFHNRPLIFIAHCFGGLVVLKALRIAFDSARKWPGIFLSTAGLIFFGTPFRGTEGMKQSEMVAAALSKYRPDQVEGESLRILVPGDEFLQDTVDRFLESRLESPPAPVACFYETKSSNVGAIVGGLVKKEFIVNEASGCLDYSESIDKIPLERTHFNINKFGKVSEPSYKVVRGVIKKMAEIALASETTQNPVEDTSSLPPDDPSRFLALSKSAEWDLGQGESFHNIFDHISDYEPDRTYRDYLRNRCQGTTRWVLDRKQFRAWLENKGSPCLWLTVGCGKTLITSTALEHIIRESQKASDLVAHFFYNYSNKSRLKATHLFRSYIKQIIGHLSMIGKPCPPSITSYVKRFYGPKVIPPNFDEIVDDIFTPLIKLLPRTIYVVDGLDECETEEVLRVLKTFRRIISQHGTKVFISGRESLNVRNFISDSFTIHISNEDVREDIHWFIERRIEEKMRERPLTETESVLQDIKTKLNEKADRMILWVTLQLETLWDECSTDADIQAVLANLPKDLNETYERCLAKISVRHGRFSRKVLRWVCAAIDPFKIDQLREALAINVNTGCLDRDKLPSAREVLKSCSNLIIWDRNDQVYLTHHSVRQFLVANAEFDLGTAELELGELCVAHLTSPDYALTLQSSGASKGPTVNFGHTLTRLREDIPSIMRFALPRPRSVPIALHQKKPKAPPATGLPSFFRFAKEQWAPLTRDMVKDSKCWNGFRTLALEPNLSWQVHPWPSLGNSVHSHYSGLLGWAIVNRHYPLLDLLFGIQNPKPKRDIFNIPFYHYSNLPALHLASRIGGVEMVRRLLQKCDHHKLDNKGRTALHHAAEIGHSDIALLLIRKKTDIKAEDDKGRSALHFAAGNGTKETVQALIERGADINAKDNYGSTALVEAARGGHKEVVQLLLERGADVNAINYNRPTALEEAARGGHKEVVQLLLDYGANTYYMANHYESTLLVEAARGGRKEVVQLLLERGVSINTKGDYGLTALEEAARGGYKEVVQLLLEYDAGVNANNDYRSTILVQAAGGGDKEIVQLLLEHGAGVNTKNDYGSTALVEAARGGHKEVVQLLLEHGADAYYMVDDYGSTALVKAARGGHKEVVQLLLERGAGINTKGDYGLTALEEAARGGYKEVVQLLLEYDAGVNANDGYRSTILVQAAGGGDKEIVQLLLERGADVNANYGSTALVRAARGGYKEIMQLLIEHGADVNTQDNYGSTALAEAAGGGYKEAVQLLRSAGAS